MKRFFLGMALLAMVSGAAADSLFSVHDKVKAVLEGQFSRTLGRAVRIERLEGNLYQRLTMHNVAIANTNSFDQGLFASAETIEIRYSLKGAIFDNFDVLAHVRQVKVIRPILAIKRDRRGNWNFLPTSNTTETGKPLHANLLVRIIDGQGTFEDRRGWGKTPTSFGSTLTSINTTVQLKNEHLTISGNAFLLGRNTEMPIVVGVVYDVLKQRGNLRVQGKKIDLGLVSNYLQLPFSVRGRGLVEVVGFLAKTQSAVDYTVSGTGIDIDYQSYTGKNICGELRKQGEQLSLALTKATIGSGLVSGNIGFSLSSARVLPGTNLVLSGVRLEKLFPAPLLTGAVTGSLQCTGPTDNVRFTLTLPKVHIVTQNQVLSALVISGNITAAGTDYSARFCLNDVWSQANGRLAEAWTGRLVNQPLRIVYASRELTSATDMRFMVNGEYNFKPDKKQFSAELSMRGKGKVVGEAIEECSAQLRYVDKAMYIPEFRVKLPHSVLAGQAVVSESYRLDITEGLIDVRDSQWLQTVFPESTGKLNISGYCSGRATFNAEITLRAEQLRYEDIFVRSAGLQLRVADTRYELPQYKVDLDGNVFSGSGLWQRDVSGNFLTQQEGLSRFELTTTHTELMALDKLIKKVQGQAKLFSARLENLGTKNITLPILEINDQAPLYAEYAQDKIQEFYQYVRMPTQNAVLGTAVLSGVLSGTMRIENDHGILAVDADTQIRYGRTDVASWDVLQCVIHTSGGTINIAASVKQLQVSPSVEIPGLNLRATYANGLVMIDECQLYSEESPPSSILTGYFPLAAFWDERFRDTPFQLQGTIHGDELNLLTPYLSGVAYMHNDGVIDVVCSGSYRAWSLSAKTLQLKDFTLGLNNPYFQQLQIKRAQLRLQNNVLEIGACDVQLAGNQKITPVFKLSGSIGTGQLSFAATESIKIFTRLLLKDMEDEEIFIKNIYNGHFTLRNASLVGTFTLPISATEKDKHKQRINNNAEEGPLLTGQLDVLNGTLYLFALEKDISVKSDKFLSLLMDLDIDVKNDIRVQTRDTILSGDVNMLSQLNVGIRENNPTVKVSGTLNYFKIVGTLYFDDGYVSVLNRTFTLLDKQEQSVYLKQTERHAGDNYLEFRETAKFTLDPHFSFAALTTVVDTVLVSNNTVTTVTTENTQTTEQEYTTVEKDYMLFIEGSVFDLASFSFQRYTKQNNVLVLDGEPYILKDASGRMIDNYRFKELVFDLAPSAVKAAWRTSTGTPGGSWDSATKEMVRDLSATEINFLMRTMIRPVERKMAQSLNLYDIKIKRDIGNKDVVSRLSFLQDSQTALQSEAQIGISQELGVQVVKDLWRERLFLTVDTSLDRDLQTNITQYSVSSWKVTYRFLKDFSLYFVVLDEVDLNYGNEKDQVLNTYIPVLSLDAIHSF